MIKLYITIYGYLKDIFTDLYHNNDLDGDCFLYSLSTYNIQWYKIYHLVIMTRIAGLSIFFMSFALKKVTLVTLNLK